MTLQTMDATRLSLARGQFRIAMTGSGSLGRLEFKWGTLAHMYPGTAQVGGDQMPLRCFSNLVISLHRRPQFAPEIALPRAHTVLN